MVRRDAHWEDEWSEGVGELEREIKGLRFSPVAGGLWSVQRLCAGCGLEGVKSHHEAERVEFRATEVQQQTQVLHFGGEDGVCEHDRCFDSKEFVIDEGLF